MKKEKKETKKVEKKEKREEKKVDFDLSVLSLTELINLYEKVNGFLQFLDESIITDEKEEK